MSVGGNQPIVFKEKDINLENTEICCYNITLRQHLWCQVIFLKKTQQNRTFFEKTKSDLVRSLTGKIAKMECCDNNV